MNAPSTDDDPYVGEVFEDQDTRNRGRLISVLEVHPEQYFTNLLIERPELRFYRAIRVDEFWQPVTNRRTRIMAKTLDENYRKVSR